MRIAWASPISRASAIGRVSADVVRTLVARGHRVDVIATELEPGAEPVHDVPAEIRSWRDAVARPLTEDYDLLVVNVGDNYLYHAGIFSLLGRAPTVGIFHDFYLYNLFSGWLWDGGRRPEAERAVLHDRILIDTYGAQAAEWVVDARSGRLGLAKMAQRAPMTEWLGARCDGALTHAAFYGSRLLACCPGPVRQAAMPVTCRDIPPLPRQARSPVTLLTVGVMNPNKCVDRVLAAIAQSRELSETLAYHLVGPIDPDESRRLTAMALERGFRNLTIHGPVDDGILRARLAEADIICCLRDPVLEGASGSAIEGMLAGRPVIVADAGFYAELPDDLVFKVGNNVAIEELTAHLERLVSDPELRRTVGRKARAWAARRFDLVGYAQAVEDLADETLQSRSVLTVARTMGRELAALGLKSEDPAVERIATQLAEIFPTR